MKVIIWMLFGTVVIYSTVELVQTKLLLDLGAQGVNPILNWLIETTGSIHVMFYIRSFALAILLILLMIYLKEEQGELGNAGTDKIK